MMKKSDITAIMKGLKKRAGTETSIFEAFDSIDEITRAVDEVEGEEPRLSLPYVNATPIGGRPWK